MFNKKIMAIILSVLFISSTANSATLYNNDGTKIDFTGSLRLWLENSDSRKQYSPGKDNLQLQDQSSRFGFGIDHAFNGGNAHGIGYIEFGNDTQSGEGDFQMDNRQGWVGFRVDDVGDLTFGHITSPFDDMPTSDFTYEYGGALDFGAYNGGFIGRTSGSDGGDNNFIGRVSNSIRVMSADFNGFSVGGSYTLQTDDDGDSWGNGVDHAYTLAAFYHNGGWNLGAGYGYAKVENSGGAYTSSDATVLHDANGQDGEESIWGASVKYTFDDVGVSLSADVGQLFMNNVWSGDVGYDNDRSDYAQREAVFFVDNKAKVNLLGLGANWKYGDGNIYGGYYLKDGDENIANWKEQKVVIGADYNFTKNIVVWSEYAYIETEADKWTDITTQTQYDYASVGDDNRIAVGMRIYF
ncbi:porin [Edaphovirga cremea]|uniref:porin n=1 Tax=Edaphovirga cremea TaxID=2267246 RepID=UPI003989555D